MSIKFLRRPELDACCVCLSVVTDNDIFSSGDVVSTLNNGAAGATYMHIARNRLWNGGTTHWGVSWKQCIYEDNEATGASTTAMGSNCEPSQPASQPACQLVLCNAL